MELSERLRVYPGLHHLTEAHEYRLAHLVGDVVRPVLLVIHREKEPLIEHVERKGSFVGPGDGDWLSPVPYDEDRVEGKCPLERPLPGCQVGDLGQQLEILSLDAGLSLDPERLQL